MLGWLKEKDERLDHCLVGEPTATARAGDTIKIGRRGSINSRVTVRGTQGHVAYPHQAINPHSGAGGAGHAAVGAGSRHRHEHFDPSTLAFTTVDVGNPATNVIPAEARAGFNIRFNDQHTPASLQKRIARCRRRDRRRNSAARSSRSTRSAALRSSPSRAPSPNCSPSAVAKSDGHEARIFHHRRHVGRALHQGSLPGRRARSFRRHNAQG